MTPTDFALAPLRKYAEFNGRARRAEYWWYALLLIVAYVVLGMVESILGIGQMLGTYGPLTASLMLATLVPSLAVGIRRLHDTSRSGWWLLIGVVPYAFMIITMMMSLAAGSVGGAMVSIGLTGVIALIGGIVLLVLMVLEGTRGDNRYGPDPLAGEGGTVAV
jgi:uncharacterized membrane protein YhaH (DUF805 family)